MVDADPRPMNKAHPPPDPRPARQAGRLFDHVDRCESCRGTIRSCEADVATPEAAPHAHTGNGAAAPGTCSTCPYAAAGVPLPTPAAAATMPPSTAHARICSIPSRGSAPSTWRGRSRRAAVDVKLDLAVAGVERVVAALAVHVVDAGAAGERVVADAAEDESSPLPPSIVSLPVAADERGRRRRRR